MARPLKDGVDYWAFDVTLLQDRKFRLIRSEFGVYGVYIALELLNLAYREHGYYAPFGEEDCLLLAESIGGCAPDLIRTVAAACCRRGLFDAGVFEACGVLTSAGIQRRYLKIVAKNRAEIRIIREYWLLDAAAERDVPAAARAKLVFIDAGQAGKPRTEGVSPAENAAERAENPQRKENKRKQKQSRSAAPRFTPPSPAEVEALPRARQRRGPRALHRLLHGERMAHRPRRHARLEGRGAQLGAQRLFGAAPARARLRGFAAVRGLRHFCRPPESPRVRIRSRRAARRRPGDSHCTKGDTAMTKELLEQYPDICAELRGLEAEAATVYSDIVTGSRTEFPYTMRTVQICGTAPVSPETAAYMELLRQQKAEIEDFADSLTSPRKRRLVRCVMQHGRRWNVIRRLMGGDKSPDAVRMEFERIFKNF